MTDSPAPSPGLLASPTPRAPGPVRWFLLFLAVLDLAIGWLVWADGGNQVTGDLLGPLAVMAFLSVLILPFWHPRLMPYFAVNAVVLLAVVLAIWHLFPIDIVHCENFSGQAVRIERDGEPWVNLASNDTIPVTLRSGRYAIVIRAASDGHELERLTAEMVSRDFLGGQRHYVLNVLGAMTYRISTHHYGQYVEDPIHERDYFRDHWFLPKADIYFQEAPQSLTVSVHKNEIAFTSMRVLYRCPDDHEENAGKDPSK